MVKDLLGNKSLSVEEIKELWSKTYNETGKPDWSHIFPFYHKDIIFQDSIQRIEGKVKFVEMCNRLAKRCRSLKMDICNIVKTDNIVMTDWKMTMSFRFFRMITVLDNSIYENIKKNVIHRFSSSPLIIERLSGNLDGGITGWTFTNDVIPAINKMSEVKKSCYMLIPDILQAGQWTFSPSGLPISILTGKIAADKAEKMLKRGKRQ